MTENPQPASTFAGVTRAQVEEWRNEYGEDHLALRSVPMGRNDRLYFILRAPTRAEFTRYLSETAKSDRSFDKMATADRNLVATCLLAPGIDEVRAAWERFPALADKMTEPVLKMAGADAEVREETF